MVRRALPLTLLVLAVFALGAKRVSYKLENDWVRPGFERHPFEKIMVIGITEDREIRHRFEDKFVSHLRGLGIGGATSYSIVADLTQADDPAPIIEAIEEQGIDGAIAVRLVSLDGTSVEDWDDAWSLAMERDGTLRAMIDDTLPIESRKLKRIGIEVDMWRTDLWRRIWGARSNRQKLKDVEKQGGGDFVQLVMRRLRDLRLVEEVPNR